MMYVYKFNRYKPKWRRFIGLGLVTLLVGCSSMPSEDMKTISKDDLQWQQHLAKVKQINVYSASGQMGIINQNKRVSMNFQWQYKNDQNFQLEFSAYLNMAGATLSMQNGILAIKDLNGKTYKHAKAQEYLQKLFGSDLPMSNLAQWLKGVPPQDYTVGENHLLYQFKYGNWQATYVSYKDYQGISMPMDILLQKGEMRIKLKISDWQWQN